MDEIRFDNRVAIITGAGAGLGKAYALEFARRGASVVVNDLGGGMDGSGSGRQAADLVVAEIRDAGGKAAANYDSVSTAEGGEGIVKTALEAFGSVDILVNNAGIVRDHSFLKMTDEEWDSVMAVHLRGSFNVTRPALRAMRDRNYGRILFVTSGVGLYGNFGQANYAAAKMGLIGLMNTLTVETAKHDIVINAIAPNAVSRMTESVFPPPIAEILLPEHITPLVMWLSSEKNTDRGMIFNCMGGWYSRAAVVCAPGFILGDGKRPARAEDIAENRDRLTSLEGARPLGSVVESFGYISPLLPK